MSPIARLRRRITAWWDEVTADLMMMLGRSRTVSLAAPVVLTRGKIRFRIADLPCQITLPGHARPLLLSVETPLAGPTPEPPALLLADAGSYRQRIGGLIRIRPQGHLLLGRESVAQRQIFGFAETVAPRQLLLMRRGDTLIARNLADGECRFGHADHAEEARRDAKLARIDALCGPVDTLLDPGAALALLRQVNDLLEHDPYRPPDHNGRPGAVVELPKKLKPIILADLHGRIDNLLTALVENGFLDALQGGKAALLIIGDAVHPEDDEDLGDMRSSMQLMDLIFRLKRRFPRQVFYLLGNHDSFAEDLSKGGVPQGLLWERALRDHRGVDYIHEMERFYASSPLLAYAKTFIACHAAPPKQRVTRDELINLRQTPSLIRELVANRMRSPQRPFGYTRGDVKRLRKALGVKGKTPLIVGHTPLDREHTLWLDAGAYRNHHVLFSAARDRVGVFSQAGGAMIPFTYPVHPMRTLLAARQAPAPRPGTGTAADCRRAAA